MRRLLDALFDFLFPSRCVCCGGSGGPLCPGCAGLIVERRAIRTIPGAGAVVAGGLYEGPLRRAILHLKRNQPEVAGALAGALWGGRLPLDSDVVTWVPAGPGRRRRGYDQGAALARAAGQIVGRPSMPLLMRRGHRGQRDLDAPRRAANATAAIGSCRPIPRWRVLLVDDVMTTGASVRRAVEVLGAAGAARVDVAVLAAVAPSRLKLTSPGADIEGVRR